MPSALVIIFGGSGDLTHKKLIPAINSLSCDGLLDDKTAVVGVARTAITHEDFRTRLLEGVSSYSRLTEDTTTTCVPWHLFRNKISYQQVSDYNDPAEYKRLYSLLFADRDTMQMMWGTPDFSPARVVIYLALPPSTYQPVVENLALGGFNKPNFTLIIEKPIGSNAVTARALEDAIGRCYPENQIARIDHYLGKMQSLNILSFRFANALIEPLWNNHYVQSITITASEDIDIEGRAGFYDQNGVIVDMIQSHLLQVLALTCMETPLNLSPDALRDEKVRLLRSVLPVLPEETIPGQYHGYQDHKGVAPGSRTPTAATLRIAIDNSRWHGVEIVLQACKCGATRDTRVDVVLKDLPHNIFTGVRSAELSNVITFLIQPQEGVQVSFDALMPTQSSAAGSQTGSFSTKPVLLKFDYKSSNLVTQSAYERLILDAILGDLSNFTRRDEVQEQWRIVQHIIQGAVTPTVYDKGVHMFTPSCTDLCQYSSNYMRFAGSARSRAGFRWYPISRAHLVHESIAAYMMTKLDLWISSHAPGQAAYNIILAGGETPYPMYQIAAEQIKKSFAKDDAAKIHIWLSDEREYRSPADAGRINGTKIAHVFSSVLPAENIHTVYPWNEPIDTTKTFEYYAACYNKLMGKVASFDLAILGLGEDGHTCSLFPGCLPTLCGENLDFLVVNVKKLGERRVTITPPVLSRIAEVYFLVLGAKKSDALARLRHAPFQPGLMPAQLAIGYISTCVFCDSAALPDSMLNKHTSLEL